MNNMENHNRGTVHEDRIKRRRKKRRTRRIIAVTLISIFMLSVLAFSAVILTRKFVPSFQIESIYEHIAIWNVNRIEIIVGPEPIYMPDSNIITDDEIYLSHSFVEKYVDEYIYFDQDENFLIITTRDSVEDITPADGSGFIIENDMLYIAASELKKRYDVEIEYVPQTSIIKFDYLNQEREKASITSKTATMRFNPSIKSAIADKLVQNDEVYVYREADGWSFIRTRKGFIGYVETSKLGNRETVAAKSEREYKKYDTWRPANGRVSLVWDQVFNIKGNSNDIIYIEREGLNVVSPTWFSVVSGDGTVEDIGSIEYVEWMHERGIQVWGLVDNCFDPDLSHEFLKSTKSRRVIIDRLIELAGIYNLDGINIDFESVAVRDGEHLIQFVRESSVFMHEAGLTLSMDVNVPKPWTSHYDRAELGRALDYVIIMAYDEHWSTAPESGSVASLGWVIEGIEETLKEVPAEKVVLGIPFYTRIWFEYDNGERDSGAYSMNGAYEHFTALGAEFEWDDLTSQYYAEHYADGVTQKVWLEDERSITKKLELIQEYELAGAAYWKRGMEKSEVWDIILEMQQNRLSQ